MRIDELGVTEEILKLSDLIRLSRMIDEYSKTFEERLKNLEIQVRKLINKVGALAPDVIENITEEDIQAVVDDLKAAGFNERYSPRDRGREEISNAFDALSPTVLKASLTLQRLKEEHQKLIDKVNGFVSTDEDK